MVVETTLGRASAFDFELLPGEELRLETLEESATRTGWIEVRSNIQLAGSGTFTLSQGASFISEVGIGDSPVSANTLLFVDTREGKNTGFAISNPSPESGLFYGPLSVSQFGESSTYSGTLRNLPGDGFELTLDSGPPDTEPPVLPLPGLVQICLDSGLVRLPVSPGPLEVSEQYMSMGMDASLDPIRRTVESQLQITSPPGGLQITGVKQSRVLGGDIIDVQGTGFSSNPASNQVTVGGDPRGVAEVLEATPTGLRARLPHGIRTGPLRVETGGQISNDYDLQVAFAAIASMELGNATRGQMTPFGVKIRQSRGEIQLEEMAIKLATGAWRTNGLTVDQSVGQMKLSRSSELSPVLDDLQTFDLKVISSNADLLQIGAFEEGEDEAMFLIDIPRTGDLRFYPAAPDFTFLLLISQEIEFDFQEALLSLPDSNSMNVDFLFKSQAERLARPGTRRNVVQNSQLSLN